MNARLYDPVIGRFLSPDPYVQMPDFTQNFNRYSYCLNNPLTYYDNSGEFIIIDSFLVGLFTGGWKKAVRMAKNDAKIWGGLFATDPNKSFGGRVVEFISRLTWQLPQTIGGFVSSHAYNTFQIAGGVDWVKYKYGATVLKTYNGNWGAFTQSNYIIGDNTIEASEYNYLFQHEYGHYIQSQQYGLLYYGTFAIPSLIDASSKRDHNLFKTEQDANIRALEYFNDKLENFNPQTDWNHRENPIIGYNPNKNITNPENQAALKTGKLSLNWYDPLLVTSLGVIPGNIISGFINAKAYVK